MKTLAIFQWFFKNNKSCVLHFSLLNYGSFNQSDGNAKVGAIQYNSACQSIERNILHLMIEYNLIHMRSAYRLSYETPEHRKPVITAELPAALMAMKIILKEEK